MTLDWSQFCELVEGDDGKSVSEPLPPLDKNMVNMDNINMVNINKVNMDKVKNRKSFASSLPGGWMSFCDEDIDDLKCQDCGELLLGHTCLTMGIVVRIFVFFNIFQFLLLMPDY